MFSKTFHAKQHNFSLANRKKKGSMTGPEQMHVFFKQPFYFNFRTESRSSQNSCWFYIPLNDSDREIAC